MTRPRRERVGMGGRTGDVDSEGWGEGTSPDNEWTGLTCASMLAGGALLATLSLAISFAQRVQ